MSLAKPIPLLLTSADETFGQFSPDGKWDRDISDETGRNEVYVREFAPDRVPEVGAGQWLVSTNGGDKPGSRRDGRKLFYSRSRHAEFLGTSNHMCLC